MSCVSQVNYTVWTAFASRAPKCCLEGLLALCDKIIAFIQTIRHLFVKQSPVLEKLNRVFPDLTYAQSQSVLDYIEQNTPKDVAVELTKVNAGELKISCGTMSDILSKERYGFRLIEYSNSYSKASFITNETRAIKSAIEQFVKVYPEGQFKVIRSQSEFYTVRCYKNGSEGDALELYIPNNGVDPDYMLLPVGVARALRELPIFLAETFPEAIDEIYCSGIIQKINGWIRDDYLSDKETLMRFFLLRYNQETKRVEFKAWREEAPKMSHSAQFECQNKRIIECGYNCFRFAPSKNIEAIARQAFARVMPGCTYREDYLDSPIRAMIRLNPAPTEFCIHFNLDNRVTVQAITVNEQGKKTIQQFGWDVYVDGGTLGEFSFAPVRRGGL